MSVESKSLLSSNIDEVEEEEVGESVRKSDEEEKEAHVAYLFAKVCFYLFIFFIVCIFMVCTFMVYIFVFEIFIWTIFTAGAKNPF